MAAIDYYGILEAIKKILDEDGTTQGNICEIEQDPTFGLGDVNKAVALTMNNRESQEGQALAAGTVHTYYAYVSAWVMGFDPTEYKRAANIRDDYLGTVELVLMRNRKLNNTVTMTELVGGRFVSARDAGTPANWVAMAEIALKLRVTARTT